MAPHPSSPQVDDPTASVEELAQALADEGYFVGVKPWRRVHTPAAARVLGWKVKTLQNRVAQGLPPLPYKVGASVQFELAVLISYIDECRKKNH